MSRSFAFAALLLAAAPAAAQDSPLQEPPLEEGDPLGDASGFDIGGEVNLMSDYRFRGVSRSDEDPAAQAGLTVRHGSGVYAGARGTTQSGRDSFRLRGPGFGDLGDVQVDLYAGYGRDLGGGFDIDAGMMYYVFAGGDGATDYVEPYVSLSYLIGPVYATAGAKYAPAQDAIGDEDMLYLFGQVDVTVPFRPWSFSVQAGHQDWGTGRCGLPSSPQPCPGGMTAIPFGSYWTWSLGGAYHVRIEGIPSTEIGLRYVDTSLPSVAGQDGTVLLTVEIGF